MRERLQEIKGLCKSILVNLHGRGLFIKNDTVLVVIYIRAVLQIITLSAELYRDYPVVLPCWMGKRTRIPFVFAAEKAQGITGFGSVECVCYIPRILFRLGKIDGYVKIAERCTRCPLDIFCDTVASYIVSSF